MRRPSFLYMYVTEELLFVAGALEPLLVDKSNRSQKEVGEVVRQPGADAGVEGRRRLFCAV